MADCSEDVKTAVHQLANELQVVIGALETDQPELSYLACRRAILILRRIAKHCAGSVPVGKRFKILMRGQ